MSHDADPTTAETAEWDEALAEAYELLDATVATVRESLAEHPPLDVAREFLAAVDDFEVASAIALAAVLRLATQPAGAA